MKNRIFNLLLLIFLFQSCIMAQDLKTHLWEDRVILLFASDFQQTALIKQLDLFKENPEGLMERKLVVYQITPNAIKKNGVDFFDKKNNKQLFKKYGLKKDEFTFVLIGLDGGEKMRATKIVSLNKLFGKIDRMPMRRSEMNH